MDSGDSKTLLKVSLPNGGSNVVKYNEGTPIKQIIHVLCSRLGAGERYFERSYAIRLFTVLSQPPQWLQNGMTIYQVKKIFNIRDFDICRLELRIRFIPRNLSELLHQDRTTFFNLYEQVKADYMMMVAEKIEVETAVQLGCLEMRMFFKDMPLSALEKMSNFEYLEKELGLKKFLPKSVLTNVKSKTLRKMIQQRFRENINLKEEECVFRFYEVLIKVWNFKTESVRCAFGSGWSVPVTLVIGPDDGISYSTDQTALPTFLTDFENIQAVMTSSDDPEKRGVVRLKAAGTKEPLRIGCNSLRSAEDLANLIEGYCQLIRTTDASYWTKEGTQDDTRCGLAMEVVSVCRSVCRRGPSRSLLAVHIDHAAGLAQKGCLVRCEPRETRDRWVERVNGVEWRERGYRQEEGCIQGPRRGVRLPALGAALERGDVLCACA